MTAVSATAHSGSNAVYTRTASPRAVASTESNASPKTDDSQEAILKARRERQSGGGESNNLRTYGADGRQTARPSQTDAAAGANSRQHASRAASTEAAEATSEKAKSVDRIA